MAAAIGAVLVGEVGCSQTLERHAERHVLDEAAVKVQVASAASGRAQASRQRVGDLDAPLERALVRHHLADLRPTT